MLFPWRFRNRLLRKRLKITSWNDTFCITQQQECLCMFFLCYQNAEFIQLISPSLVSCSISLHWRLECIFLQSGELLTDIGWKESNFSISNYVISNFTDNRYLIMVNLDLPVVLLSSLFVVTVVYGQEQEYKPAISFCNSHSFFL